MRSELDDQDTAAADRSEDAAVDLMATYKDEGIVVGFGGATQTPRAEYSLEELRLNKIEAEKLLSPEDSTLSSVQNKLLIVLCAAVGLAVGLGHWGSDQLLTTAVAGTFFLGTDQVLSGGGVTGLLLDSAARVLEPEYARRVAMHEAGHLLVAYLLGLLPKAYTLSSWDAARRYSALNIQAGCRFCDASFNREVQSGKITSGSLDRFVCVALAGVATEYVHYDRAEGGMADVQQIDQLLRALGFTQKKADSQIRWSVLNTVTLLRRHRALHLKLAECMRSGTSVAACVNLIETELAAMPEGAAI